MIQAPLLLKNKALNLKAALVSSYKEYHKSSARTAEVRLDNIEAHKNDCLSGERDVRRFHHSDLRKI
ncbi:hypothetical protein D3C75_1235510 [compost metagenome]